MVNLIVTIISYKFTESSLEELEAMLGLEDAKQTRWGQELLAKGEEVGIAKGRQEGRQEGRVEGKLEVVPVMLERGFSFEEVAELLKLELDQVRQVTEPEKPSQSL